MKITGISILLICLAFSSLAFSQTSKEYDFKDFTEIKVSHAFNVEIKQGPNYSFRLECEERLVENLDIQLDGNTVSINLSGKKNNVKEQPKIWIEMPTLSELDVNGACDVKLVRFDLESLDIELTGASELEADLNVQNIQIEASGASELRMSGMTNKMDLTLTGASQFKGKGFLVSDEFVFNASGASMANCQVDGDMVIKLSGASSLDYHGSGDILKQNTSGASSINKKE